MFFLYRKYTDFYVKITVKCAVFQLITLIFGCVCQGAFLAKILVVNIVFYQVTN